MASCCNCSSSSTNASFNKKNWLLQSGVLLVFWLLLYRYNEPFSEWVTFDLLTLSEQSQVGQAVSFFLYDSLKILLLLTLLVYALAWLRAGMDVARVRDRLSGMNRWLGYGAAALFGAVTPFCSCSSIPLFLGFTAAGIPLGITLAFLITSPMINEVAVVVLWGLLGWKVTLLYIGVGLLAGVLGGFFFDKIAADRWLQPYLKDMIGAVIQGTDASKVSIDWAYRHAFAKSETVQIVKRVWLWVLAGVALGALIHGFVPEGWFAEYLGRKEWWSVPVSVVVGIPLYTNVTGVIPVMETLINKGLPLGTTLAFIMSTVAASIPEFVMLKEVMTVRLLAAFFAYLLMFFTFVGWILNAAQSFL